MAKIFITLLLLAGLTAAAVGGYNLLRPLALNEGQRSFQIQPGETVKQITRRLKEQDIVNNDFWLRTLVWLTQSEGKFIAGTVDLPEKVSNLELWRLLTGSVKRPVRTLTIPEGWTIRDIAIYFEREAMFQQEELTELVGLPGVFGSSDNDFYSELAVKYKLLLARVAAAPLEGYLFPDTYEVFANATVKDIVTKMVDNFDKKFSQDLRDEVARQGKSLYNVLIMASIIEAEVPHEADRPVVADIFWSRLARGVPLQSDATLKYVIGGKRPALTAEELKIDSAYNTYKNKGLPPTPIGNPGLSALRAAVYPAKTDYFYFLSTPDGQTIFSKTLEEHNANKTKYLK